MKKVLVSHERCGDPGCVVCWGLAQWRGTMGGSDFRIVATLTLPCSIDWAALPDGLGFPLDMLSCVDQPCPDISMREFSCKGVVFHLT